MYSLCKRGLDLWLIVIEGSLEECSGLDWSDGINHELSEVLSSVEVGLSIPVSSECCDIAVNGIVVEEVVLADGGSKGAWVGEDGAPGFDGGEIISHLVAGVEGLWDLEDDEAEFKDSLHVIVPSSLFDIIDSLLDLWSHDLPSLGTGHDLSQVVVLHHAVHESTDELWDCDW